VPESFATETKVKDNTARVEQFFSGLMVACWRQAMPEQVTEQEVDFLQQQLRLAPGARVLDVPCGTGRHSCALVARGYQVTGVDLSSTCLSDARALAAKKGLSVTWEHRDMSDLPWTGTFDAACAMGNSLGYVDDDHDARFVAAVARALKPAGRFAVDYPAVAEALLPSFQERTWYPIGDTLFLREGRYNHLAGRIETEYTLVRAGQVEKKPWTQRVYTYLQVCRLLAGAGFTDLQGYASPALDPFKLGARGLLLVATKKGS
jgi:SAM-dependent methyltransferase